MKPSLLQGHPKTQMLVRMHWNWISHTLAVGLWNVTTTWENSMSSPWRIKHTLTTWPSNHTPRHLSQRNETCVYIKSYTQFFLVDFFVIAQNWSQPKCPTISQWFFRKLSYSHILEYYSAIKSHGLSTHTATRMDRKGTMLSRGEKFISNVTYSKIPVIQNSQNNKTPDVENRSVAAGGCRRREM